MADHCAHLVVAGVESLLEGGVRLAQGFHLFGQSQRGDGSGVFRLGKHCQHPADFGGFLVVFMVADAPVGRHLLVEQLGGCAALVHSRVGVCVDNQTDSSRGVVAQLVRLAHLRRADESPLAVDNRRQQAGDVGVCRRFVVDVEGGGSRLVDVFHCGGMEVAACADSHLRHAERLDLFCHNDMFFESYIVLLVESEDSAGAVKPSNDA